MAFWIVFSKTAYVLINAFNPSLNLTISIFFSADYGGRRGANQNSKTCKAPVSSPPLAYLLITLQLFLSTIIGVNALKAENVKADKKPTRMTLSRAHTCTSVDVAKLLSKRRGRVKLLSAAVKRCSA